MEWVQGKFPICHTIAFYSKRLLLLWPLILSLIPAPLPSPPHPSLKSSFLLPLKTWDTDSPAACSLPPSLFMEPGIPPGSALTYPVPEAKTMHQYLTHSWLPLCHSQLLLTMLFLSLSKQKKRKANQTTHPCFFSLTASFCCKMPPWCNGYPWSPFLLFLESALLILLLPLPLELRLVEFPVPSWL